MDRLEVDDRIPPFILDYVKPLIVVDHITYAYRAPGASPIPALQDLSLQIEDGEYLAIIGANGSGKSTLARHLNALLIPESGHVYVNGLDTADRRAHVEIRQTVGMVFQRPEDQVVATIVEEDVAFGPENLGLPPTEIRQRVDVALKAVDLWAQRRRPPHMLSVGQMQRLALAGALAMRPQCLVFDETTAMLDPLGRLAARALIRDLHRSGLTIVLITHLMEEALDADRVVVLDHGSLAMEGPPEEIFREAQRLRALGLDQPPVALLAESLRAYLPQLPATILHEEELIEALAPLSPGAAPDSFPSSKSSDPRQSPLATVTGLSHTYGIGTPFAHRALHDVNLSVSANSIHGLAGATGSGKSTLLQHLNGLLLPQKGTVKVGPYDLGDHKLDLREVRRFAGLAFQQPETQFFEQFVGDEIAYGPRLAGLQGEDLRRRVAWAMAQVGLDFDTFRDRLTFTLSGGEQRKVALASILALRPRLLLLDEPTAGLDPQSKRELIGHLLNLNRQGVTLLISSHQMDELGALTDRLTILSRGTSVAEGSSSAIFSEPTRLAEWHLMPPMAASIAERLRRLGWQLPYGITREDELLTAILQALEVQHYGI